MAITPAIVSKCVLKGIDPDYFYPLIPRGRPKVGNEGDQLDRVQRKAAEFCNGTTDSVVCGFKQQCLEMGMLNEEPGVWGGTTEAERRVMLRRIRKRVDIITFYIEEVAV